MSAVAQKVAGTKVNVLQSDLKPDQVVAQFKSTQIERSKKQLERRVKRFEESMDDPKSVAFQVMVRRVQMDRLRNEIKDKQDAMKAIKEEIKALRGNKRRNKSSKSDAEKAAEAAAK